MANPLQHGQHPDADQLNAFMEKALPEHERLATLAHLAACEGCRDIVFLAQKDLLPEVPVAAEQNSQPWWRVWWRPALVAGAAFACLALVLVSVERQLVVKNQTRLVDEAKKEATNVPSPSLDTPQAGETPESALAAKKLQQSPLHAQGRLGRALPEQSAPHPGGVAGGILSGIGAGPEVATAPPNNAKNASAVRSSGASNRGMPYVRNPQPHCATADEWGCRRRTTDSNWRTAPSVDRAWARF